ncbi:MAG TPA: type VI secretion system tube protein Hcp [Bryobacteraceae bacterium]|nr:type VI secretion system tube protein Hcp [Bryobacteraceae bacterium]
METQDYYLKLDGIEGESVDPTMPGNIRIQSWSMCVTNAIGSKSGMEMGKSAWKTLDFTAEVERSVALLHRSCALGERIKKAVLTIRKAGQRQQPYLIITLSDALVEHFEVGKVSDKGIPMMYFTLSFSKIETEESEQMQTGQLGGTIKTIYVIPRGGGGA